jgi:predicted alpha/beta-fold hydrolase
LQDVATATTVRAFDEAITRHTFGWPSVDAYYAGSSSSLSVPKLRVPTLCIQALDDPIAPREAIPYAALAANDKCVLVCTRTGGHLGWVSADTEGGVVGEPWTDAVVEEWLCAVMERLPARGDGSNNGKVTVAAGDLAGR